MGLEYQLIVAINAEAKEGVYPKETSKSMIGLPQSLEKQSVIISQ